MVSRVSEPLLLRCNTCIHVVMLYVYPVLVIYRRFNSPAAQKQLVLNGIMLHKLLVEGGLKVSPAIFLLVHLISCCAVNRIRATARSFSG